MVDYEGSRLVERRRMNSCQFCGSPTWARNEKLTYGPYPNQPVVAYWCISKWCSRYPVRLVNPYRYRVVGR